MIETDGYLVFIFFSEVEKEVINSMNKVKI